MRSLGLLLLRLVFGGLAMVHGYPKLFGGPQKRVPPQAERILGQGFTQSVQQGGYANFKGMVQSMQMPAPDVLAPVSAGAEFFGGLAVLLGWRTRLASLLLMAQMGTAIRKVHWDRGIQGQGGAELALLFFGAFLTLFFTGPGKIALDFD